MPIKSLRAPEGWALSHPKSGYDKARQNGHSSQRNAPQGDFPCWPRAFPEQIGPKDYLQRGSSSLDLNNLGDGRHPVFQDEQHIVARWAEVSA